MSRANTGKYRERLPNNNEDEPAGKPGDRRPSGGGEPGFYHPGDDEISDRMRDHAHVQSSTSKLGKNLFTGRVEYPKAQRSDQGDYEEYEG